MPPRDGAEGKALCADAAFVQPHGLARSVSRGLLVPVPLPRRRLSQSSSFGAQATAAGSTARRPAVSTKPNSLLLLCRAPAALPPPARPPAPRRGCPDHRRARPQPGMGPAAVTVQAESQRFGNLRFVVTSRFPNLLRVNWILQWEFLGGLCGARLGPASAGRPVCGCRAAGNVF